MWTRYILACVAALALAPSVQGAEPFVLALPAPVTSADDPASPISFELPVEETAPTAPGQEQIVPVEGGKITITTNFTPDVFPVVGVAVEQVAAAAVACPPAACPPACAPVAKWKVNVLIPNTICRKRPYYSVKKCKDTVCVWVCKECKCCCPSQTPCCTACGKSGCLVPEQQTVITKWLVLNDQKDNCKLVCNDPGKEKDYPVQGYVVRSIPQ